MTDYNSVDMDVLELERKSKEFIRLLFDICEKRVAENPRSTSQEYLALEASALTLQKAISAFLAVEKLCE